MKEYMKNFEETERKAQLRHIVRVSIDEKEENNSSTYSQSNPPASRDFMCRIF